MAGAGKVVGGNLSIDRDSCKSQIARRPRSNGLLASSSDRGAQSGRRQVRTETLLIQNNIIMAEGPPDSQRFGQAIRAALAA
jgi:hypothetical protein